MIKRLIVFSGVLLIFSFSVEARKLDGKIICKNDTINCQIKVLIDPIIEEPDWESLQLRVKYVDDSGNSHIAKPNEIDEYRFLYNDQEYIMKSVPLNFIFLYRKNTKYRIFLKQLVDGDLRLYEYFNKTNKYGYQYEDQLAKSYLLLDKFSNYSRVPILKFEKKMSDYFSDCSELVEKIEREKLRRYDMETIVQYYNENCGK